MDHPTVSLTLRTRRLCLRAWQSEDRKPFAELNGDAAVMQHFPEPLSPAQSDELADRIEEHWRREGWGLWAVEIAARRCFAGFVGLSRVAFAAHFTPAVEVGWRLARPQWGQGYATEAATAAVNYGFETLGLTEIVSFTSVGNLRSRRVMERLGMRRDPRDDFDHPGIPSTDRLSRHVLYRLPRSEGHPRRTESAPSLQP